MRRRDVLALLAGFAVPLPLAAIAQQSERARVIGVLIGLAENDPDIALRLAGFQHGLQDLGWIEGRNIKVHYRSAGDAARLH